MRNFIKASILYFILLLFGCTENKIEVDKNQLNGMRTTAVEFMKGLKNILINQIQTGGVLQAVYVCSDTAQVLTNNFGIEKGVFIKRVSFKNRNVNNSPDEFEKKVLNKFELLKQNNELNDQTEHSEIVKEGEFTYIRYLKPILVQSECLNCHGTESDILPEVKEHISKRYPQDKAVGYKIGDLRGAVSLKKSL